MWGGFGLKCEEKLEVSLIIFVLDYLVEVEIKEFLKMWRSDPNVKGFFFFSFKQYFFGPDSVWEQDVHLCLILWVGGASVCFLFLFLTLD